MPTDNRTSELVINKLSKQQYENIQNPSPTELYLVPEDEEHKPICYPTTASEVKTTSMVVKSSVSDNGKILTENGFVYNTSGNPTISDTKVVCDLGVGFMEKKLENLTHNTEYHIKSYGQNSSGLVYGSELVQLTKNNPIPGEYQLVEYLYSNGSQYLSLGYIEFTEFTIKCLCTNGVIFGTSIGTAIILSGNMINGGNFTFGSTVWQAQSVIQEPHEYTMKSNNTFLKDGVLYHNIQSVVYSNIFDLYRYTRISGTTYYYANGFISYLKTYKNEQCTISLYPVYRIADNKPGMYDIVNGVFYTNQGTGEFTVGPDKEFDE